MLARSREPGNKNAPELSVSKGSGNFKPKTCSRCSGGTISEEAALSRVS